MATNRGRLQLNIQGRMLMIEDLLPEERVKLWWEYSHNLSRCDSYLINHQGFAWEVAPGQIISRKELSNQYLQLLIKLSPCFSEGRST